MFTTNLAMTQFPASFHEAFLAQFGHNAELNIVEELTNSRPKQQQQTFMNPTIRGKLNNLKLKGNEA